MIHRLYPIINIQAVVCTNTPSNHGGSPGRRIIFKLGSVVAAVPAPSRRSLPLLPGRRGTGTGRSPRSPGLRDPTGKRGCSPRLPRSAFKGEGSTSPAPLSGRGRGFVWLRLLSSPGALPAAPPAAPRRAGGRRGERQPRRRYFYSPPHLCSARPLPCRALPSGCISPLAGEAGAAGGPPFTSSCPAGPPAPPPAGPGPCARGSAPQQPSARGDSAGAGGGDTEARRKQTKWPRYASGRRGGGSSQPACPPPAAGLPPPFPRPGQGPCLQPVPPRPPRWARRCAFPTELCPGPATASPGRGGSRPRAAVGRPSFPTAGWPRRACVCLPVPPGLSAPSGKRGPEDREHLRSFVERGKGAEQSKHNRRDLSFVFVRKIAVLSP